MIHEKLIATDRVFPTPTTSATKGQICWDLKKSLWISFMTIAGLIGGTIFFSWSSVAVFLLLTAITICAGHSVGMHRLLIHKSFSTPLWVEHILVYLGTLVGMSGPFGMIRIHDMRDWQQSQSECAPFASHDAGFWRDAFWQMHCKFHLENPPELRIEPRIEDDTFYQIIDRTWMAQQIPLALTLLILGGWGWVFWGIGLRIAASLTGHWIMVHFTHRTGHQGWRIKGLPVQGYNIPGLGLLTFGENWHGNHHAFPHSAKLGVEQGQTDPGYIFIKILEKLGLASDIQLPESQPHRFGLTRVGNNSEFPTQNRKKAIFVQCKSLSW